MPERFYPESDDAEGVNQAETFETGNDAVYGPSVLMAALNQIEVLVEEARTVPLSPNVIVNRAGVLDLVSQAREALPEDLVAADAVVADADAVLDRADATAEVTVAEANAKARSLIEEARDKADAMLREAVEEADRKVLGAQNEAAEIRARTTKEVDSMMEDARKAAARAVSQEVVRRTAEEEARELLYDAQTKAGDLRLGADDYAATTLAQVTQVLTDLLRRTEAGRRTIAERTGFDHTDVDLSS